MKRLLLVLLIPFLAQVLSAQAADPLRVFIRAGEKTHGPNQHDHPRFLKEWTALLNERGAKATGALDFPTGEQLDQSDVVVFYCANGIELAETQKANLEKYLKRGGGLVFIHD